MKGYAVIEVFQTEHVQQLRLATLLVSKLPGHDAKGRYVRCHELARAVAPFLATYWRIVDGQIGCVEHTWLFDRMNRVVLDLYMPARAPQVQLVHTFPPDLAPYRAGKKRRDIRRGVVQWLNLKMNQRGKRT